MTVKCDEKGDLRACPFCGGVAKLSYSGRRYSVWCGGCNVSTAEYPTMAEAVVAWDVRVGDYLHGDCRRCSDGEDGIGCPWYGEPCGCNRMDIRDNVLAGLIP